ncbi:LPXTG cell wall anchor domain-containing protein [Streptococcus uberis]|uniref:G5 domain-containing protein n=1 Tax=Streptococcus uberis TaxID=1349 RepID=UPI0012B67980|nr:G5 domain-containing protein [Streptococcus uberis]MTC91092.1 LPXTG cell wall anchor domain-containing protein [Streptococcus uberis]MTC96963.1 LPXTG cell wall anchor domain-containing protein [Streptococcus uberis]
MSKPMIKKKKAISIQKSEKPILGFTFGALLLSTVFTPSVFAEEVASSLGYATSGLLSVSVPKGLTSLETTTYLMANESPSNTLTSDTISSDNGGTASNPNETVTTETTSEAIPFDTEVIQNPDLPVGEIKVVQEGVAGEVTVTKTTTTITQNGVSQSTTTESRVPVKKPINKIIEVGTKEISPSPSSSDVITVSPSPSSTSSESSQQGSLTPTPKSRQNSQEKKGSQTKKSKDDAKEKEGDKKELPPTGSQESGIFSLFSALISTALGLFLLKSNKND